jgi:hypothetical protein
MSDGNQYEVFLRGKEAALMAELAAVRAALADLARVTAKVSGQNTEAPPASKDDGNEPRPKRTSRDKAKPYSGLTISDALVEALEASGIPMSTAQIWAALQQGGVEPIAEDSVRAITWALRKRARNHGDVVHIAYGKWGLRKWYSEAKLRKLAKVNTGRGGASTEVHASRTKAGIEKRRAAGLQVGARSRMTPERCAEVERMIRAGYSLAATAREIGVVPATIYNNMGRDKIAALRAEADEAGGEDSSPQQPAAEEPGHLRVIK